VTDGLLFSLSCPSDIHLFAKSPLTKERDLGWASTSKLPFSWFLYKLLRPNPKLERALERHSLEVDKSKFLKE
jgi:hypothetical protein